jgi:hypothetical protein
MGRGCAAVPPAVHAGNYRVPTLLFLLDGTLLSSFLASGAALHAANRSATRNHGTDLHYGAVAHLCGLLPGLVLLWAGQRATAPPRRAVQRGAGNRPVRTRVAAEQSGVLSRRS